MLKLPYGISDFSNMPLEQYFYVDRYYLGILTIEGSDELDELVFQMPNFVIRQLYYKFFNRLILQEAQMMPAVVDVGATIAFVF